MREIITDARADYGKQIFQTLSGQLGWSYFVLIIAFDECRLKLNANNHARSVEIIRNSKNQGWISKYLVDFPLQKLFMEFLKKTIQHTNQEGYEILTAQEAK